MIKKRYALKNKKNRENIMKHEDAYSIYARKCHSAYENKFSSPLPFLCTIASDSIML